MRGKLALLLALLLLPSLAHAGGFDLAWGPSCWPDNPVSVKSFACTNNQGTNVFTVSFISDAPFDNFAFLRQTLDISSSTSSLPAWWDVVNSGSCRQFGISETADFINVTSTCVDTWQGQAGSGIASYKTHALDPTVPVNGARMVAAGGLATAESIDATSEYFGFSITVNHTKSLGIGSCAGCLTPVTISLSSVQLLDDHQVQLDLLTNAIHNGCVSWQSDSGTPCGAVPAKNLTWGRVQALYR